MSKIQVQVFGGSLTKATKGSAGYDIKSTESLTLKPDETVKVKTGLTIVIPEGYEGQIRGRSGLNYRGLIVNFGTIDSDYRGEVLIVVYNRTTEEQSILVGERIAQLIFNELPEAEILEKPVELLQNLEKTERGIGGFGSTNKI